MAQRDDKRMRNNGIFCTKVQKNPLLRIVCSSLCVPFAISGGRERQLVVDAEYIFNGAKNLKWQLLRREEATQRQQRNMR